ncbi:hypothetical protein NDU88_010373 [Pleurodeles waltl]|uniref:Uncharacterized protein n=1 Tax=Pleurodeles waltl TaxID=8319 RepID=A0AAV7S2H1_PLEWA|nr:hypothetical protein NDU88_010373 [Pleurodeles waltl]
MPLPVPRSSHRTPRGRRNSLAPGRQGSPLCLPSLGSLFAAPAAAPRLSGLPPAPSRCARPSAPALRGLAPSHSSPAPAEVQAAGSSHRRSSSDPRVRV